MPAFDRSLDLASGVVVAKRYTLKHELGRGASGTVWEAEHNLLTSRVAIKFLEASCVATEQQAETLLERFRFEAQICARLASLTDRIVPVHDAGLFRGVPYIVMELAPGETLDDAIQRAPLGPLEVARVLEQLAEAVDAAHGAGLAHRDIKPANILCQSGERRGFKLADFGVAKLFRDSSLGLDSPKQTTANVLVGSPAYMCPEYVSGTPTTNGAGDLWAMAVVGYEALTQRLPFEGDTFMQVAMAIMQGRFVPASRTVAGLRPEVDAFFARALALDPAARFSSATELARAFRAAVETAETSTVPEPAPMSPVSEPDPPATSRPRRALWLVSFALAAVVGVAGVWRFVLSGAESSAAPASSAVETRPAPPPIAPSATPSAVSSDPTEPLDIADLPSVTPPARPSSTPASRSEPSASARPDGAQPAPRRPTKQPNPSEVL